MGDGGRKGIRRWGTCRGGGRAGMVGMVGAIRNAREGKRGFTRM